MHFIVIERHDAPVVSFHSYVNAGAVDDPSGETGIAHMFEHMAFKGTEAIGTTNYPAEKAALEQVEQIYDGLQQLGGKRMDQHHPVDPKRRQAVEERLQAAMEKAEQLRDPERVRSHRGGERRRGHERLHF